MQGHSDQGTISPSTSVSENEIMYREGYGVKNNRAGLCAENMGISRIIYTYKRSLGRYRTNLIRDTPPELTIPPHVHTMHTPIEWNLAI